MTRAEVLVVVVTHDSADVVGDCLRALPAAMGPGVVGRTVVVDNASRDGTAAEVAEADPSADFVPLGTNRGYAAGVNAALERFETCGADALLVLNPDVRMGRGSVATLLAALGCSDTGIAVPRLVDGAGEPLPSLRREPSLAGAFGEAVLGGWRAGRLGIGELVVDPEAYERPGVADWATGAAMLVSRRCLDVVGPWDESFFLYSEETDFCLRARDAGFSVRYEPTAMARHLGGESNTSPELWAILTRNRVRLYRKRHGSLRGAGFAVAAALNEVLRAPFRPTARAGLSALVGRRRGPARPGASTVDGYVCFSAQDWWYFNRGHSDFQLMTRVARRRPVLLVNSLGMRMPTRGGTTTPIRRVLRKARSAARGLRRPVESAPGFHVYTPLFLPVYGSGTIARWNQRAVLAQVRWVSRRLGLRRPTVVVTLPTAWPVARGLDRSSLVAYRSDRYSALPEADGEHVAGLERELLGAADVSLFASGALRAEEGALTRRPVVLGHGVDLERFRLAGELPEHPRLAHVPRPRVGYVGMIDGYTVDVELLERVAVDHPGAQLVLVGPVEVDLDHLLALPNVHHLGIVPFEEVPAVLGSIDVALLPWQTNEWIHHCNPIKLNEYLAVGLPVVSTDFPEVRPLVDVVAVTADSDEFSARVGDLLWGRDTVSAGERRAAVAGRSWDAQARRLMDLAEGVDGEAVAGTCVAS